MMTKRLVSKICATPDIDCRGTNLFGLARELMNHFDIPASAKILEIPVSEKENVVVAFRLPDDNRDYELAVSNDNGHAIYIDGYWDEQGNLQLYDELIEVQGFVSVEQ